MRPINLHLVMASKTIRPFCNSYKYVAVSAISLIQGTMKVLLSLALFSSFWFRTVYAAPKGACRNRLGDPGWPSIAEWSKLNVTVQGRLSKAIPTSEYCKTMPGGVCTDAQWNSALFRINNPGSMLGVSHSSYSFPTALMWNFSVQLRTGEIVTLLSVSPDSALILFEGLRFCPTFALSTQLFDVWARKCSYLCRHSVFCQGYTSEEYLYSFRC